MVDGPMVDALNGYSIRGKKFYARQDGSYNDSP